MLKQYECIAKGLLGFTKGKLYSLALDGNLYDDDGDKRSVTHLYDKNKFKLKEKETTMLDPEIYAVGTVHKSLHDGREYRVIARDVKTNEFNSGYALVCIDHHGRKPTPLTFCQSTGKFIDGSTNGLVVQKKKHKGWISVYKSSTKDAKDVECGFIWPSREAALRANDHDERVIAVIEVEFEEGQGL